MHHEGMHFETLIPTYSSFDMPTCLMLDSEKKAMSYGVKMVYTSKTRDSVFIYFRISNENRYMNLEIV
jgi:hypothetical protein